MTHAETVEKLYLDKDTLKLIVERLHRGPSSTARASGPLAGKSTQDM
jgi:hypothetical protein